MGINSFLPVSANCFIIATPTISKKPAKNKKPSSLLTPYVRKERVIKLVNPQILT